MKYEINLIDDSRDEFEKKGDNVISIKVFNQQWEDISEQK